MPRRCELRELGLTDWKSAFVFQQQLVERRKSGAIADQFLIVEHPHVVTMGRNGHESNLLASPELLSRSGIGFHETNRGGDVTYHGPGQIVGYPILDLRDWKRDVRAYVRAVEQTLIDALADFGIEGDRIPGLTGVWVGGAKIAAIGVHLSRWVTSHGFALNLNPDLTFFQYIIPCGLSKPVTSMEMLGVRPRWSGVVSRIAHHFARVFDCDLQQPSKPEFESEPAPVLVS